MYTYKDKVKFIWCQCKYVLRKAWRKIKRRLHLRSKTAKSVYGYRFADLSAAQNKIYDLILSGKPFMAARMGGVESLNAIEAIQVDMGFKRHISEKIMQKAQVNAGFFPPTEEYIKRFSALIQDSIKQVDVLGSMPTNNEEYLLKTNLPKDATVTKIGNLEPYYFEKPWSRALKGKKVLVIYPFKDSIISQYQKRSKLFENKDVLPDFELHVLKAVQSIAGTQTEFPDWFAALDYMYEEAMKIDFDVALIGCGAYGFPLAAKLKKAGKQAIHLGGAVQIMFGIIGARWNSVPKVKEMFNDYWVHPSADEIPKNAQKVEGGCYW